MHCRKITDCWYDSVGQTPLVCPFSLCIVVSYYAILPEVLAHCMRNEKKKTTWKSKMFTSKLFTMAVTHWNNVTSWNTAGSGHIVGCQWDHLRLCYKSCTSAVKTEQRLVQVIIDTLPYDVCKIVCISFVKKHLVLRDKNELVSHCSWHCCCGRGDICSAKTIMIGWCICSQCKSLENQPQCNNGGVTVSRLFAFYVETLKPNQ